MLFVFNFTFSFIHIFKYGIEALIKPKPCINFIQKR